MTTAEKISLMGNTNGAEPVNRLGVGALPWGEGLHGVVSHCFTPPGAAAKPACPTSFPHALAMAASFNRTLWRAVGDAISTEARALNNLGTSDYLNQHDYAPLMLWAPNLNPYRDPRWGRGHETPGEDPFVGAEYGVELITGLQWGANATDTNARYMKTVAIVKHSFDYDIEGNHGPADRTAFNAVVSDVDQNNYFSPPFEAAITRAKASGLMCSYNGINGVPSCMNAALNNERVREQWGMADGVIVSDCGAVGDTFATAYIKSKFPGSPAEEEAAQVQQGLRGGCDFNCGKFYQAHMSAALARSAVNISDVDQAVTRLLKKAFQLGLFDPPEQVPYSSYGAEQLATAESAALALAGATQSIVLLQNKPVALSVGSRGGATAAAGPVLPLAPGAKVALIGPHANATDDLLSNYRGDNNLVYEHSPMLAMTKRGNVVGHAAGCSLQSADESGFAEAVALAAAAEVAVVFCGLHPQWFDNVGNMDVNEGEDRDRANITLPDVQLRLIQAVAATGTPVVLVLINGGQLAIPWAKANVPAVVEAFYPGQLGGDAIAAVLHGDVSPSGRLPYTMYDADFTSRRPDIGDMSLSGGGGLTYQYYDGEALWPFGWGLSYTTFALRWSSASGAAQTASQRVLTDQLLRRRAGGVGDRNRTSAVLPLPAMPEQRRAAVVAYTVTATNTGKVTSDLSVLAFMSAAAGAAANERPAGSHVGAVPQRELFAFCRLRAIAPGQSAQCELAVAASVVAHNATIFAGNYAVSVELGDGTGIGGSLLVV